MNTDEVHACIYDNLPQPRCPLNIQLKYTEHPT